MLCLISQRAISLQIIDFLLFRSLLTNGPFRFFNTTGQVERMVEQAYEQYLFDECKKQTNYKSGLEKQARKEKDPEKQQLHARRAAEFELTRCVELDDLFPDRRRKKTQQYRKY